MLDGSLLSEERSESTDLGSEGSLDVRGSVGGEVSNAREESSEDDISVDELGESCEREGDKETGKWESEVGEKRKEEKTNQGSVQQRRFEPQPRYP